MLSVTSALRRVRAVMAELESELPGPDTLANGFPGEPTRVEELAAEAVAAFAELDRLLDSP